MEIEREYYQYLQINEDSICLIGGEEIIWKMYISEIEIVAFYGSDKAGDWIDVITFVDIDGNKKCFNLSSIRNYQGVKSWLNSLYNFDKVNWNYFGDKTAIFYPFSLYGKPLYNSFKTFWLRIFTEQGGFLKRPIKNYLKGKKIEKEKLANNLKH